LRSFVTTFTANAGYDPIIFPSINFAHTGAKEDVNKGLDNSVQEEPNNQK
jgi:preprotein translocase subunit SecB